MKKYLLILGLVIVFVSGSTQDKPQKVKPADNPNAPEITFQKVIHDYGTIAKGANGTCEFIFKNTGKEPLILSRPRSNCGCTVPTYPREPILPGKTGAIKVIYDTKRMGPINKSVTVFSNAKNNPVVLRIKGMVKVPKSN